MQFHSHANQSHFHKNGFALRLALKQRHKRTQKWPIVRFSPSAKYHRLIVKERDTNFSHFQRVVFQKCGSLFPQKDDFLIVAYTDINIQFS